MRYGPIRAGGGSSSAGPRAVSPTHPVETSRPTTIAEPTFVYHGVTHFCVPNFTADLGRSASVAVAQAMLPYVATIARHGVQGALELCPDLKRGVYALRGSQL